MAEFIKHDGGGRPHCPSTYVEVKLRDGRLRRAVSAVFCWPWVEIEHVEGYADDDDPGGDILEWREIPRPPTKDEIIAELLSALKSVCAILDRHHEPSEARLFPDAEALAADIESERIHELVTRVIAKATGEGA